MSATAATATMLACSGAVRVASGIWWVIRKAT